MFQYVKKSYISNHPDLENATNYILEGTVFIDKRKITKIRSPNCQTNFEGIQYLDDFLLWKVFQMTMIYYWGFYLGDIKMVCKKWNNICQKYENQNLHNLKFRIVTNNRFLGLQTKKNSKKHKRGRIEFEIKDLNGIEFYQDTNISQRRMFEIFKNPHEILIYKGLRFIKSDILSKNKMKNFHFKKPINPDYMDKLNIIKNGNKN